MKPPTKMNIGIEIEPSIPMNDLDRDKMFNELRKEELCMAIEDLVREKLGRLPFNARITASVTNPV